MRMRTWTILVAIMIAGVDSPRASTRARAADATARDRVARRAMAAEAVPDPPSVMSVAGSFPTMTTKAVMRGRSLTVGTERCRGSRTRPPRPLPIRRRRERRPERWQPEWRFGKRIIGARPQWRQRHHKPRHTRAERDRIQAGRAAGVVGGAERWSRIEFGQPRALAVIPAI